MEIRGKIVGKKCGYPGRRVVNVRLREVVKVYIARSLDTFSVAT